jgi:hypothetical protein
MIFIILSLGALNAFIPLIIILILIAAAAGLMRGYNIFSIFGISALLGMAQAKGSMIGKSASRATSLTISKSRTAKVVSNLGKKLGKTTQVKTINTMNVVKSSAQLGRNVYLTGLSQGLTNYQALSASKSAVSAQRHADKLSGLSNPTGSGALDRLEKNVNEVESKGLISSADAKNIYAEIASARQSIANAARHAQNAATNPANASNSLKSVSIKYQAARTKAINAVNLARNAAEIAQARAKAGYPSWLIDKAHKGMVKLAAESVVHGNPNYKPGIPPNMKNVKIHNPKIAQKYENLASDVEQNALAKVPNKAKTAIGYNYMTSPQFKTDIQNNQIIEGLNYTIKKADKITKML